ncbi:MAG: HIT domain-containing protein [Ignavibacteriaceae bacterium]|nr:HIT domain-containing protein [Ignavibacteriaceae bacterium]
MEKLWSPWRSKYIESFKSDSDSNECIFCQMVGLDPHDDNNLIINQSEFTFTVLNLYPYNNGHLMIVPKRHLSEFSELNDKELLEVMKKLQHAQLALTKAMKPHGFNIGTNIGRVSGAGIEEHIHFHIVPRWNGDTNFMPVIGEVKVISQDLLDTKKKLIEAYKEINL